MANKLLSLTLGAVLGAALVLSTTGCAHQPAAVMPVDPSDQPIPPKEDVVPTKAEDPEKPAAADKKVKPAATRTPKPTPPLPPSPPRGSK